MYSRTDITQITISPSSIRFFWEIGTTISHHSNSDSNRQFYSEMRIDFDSFVKFYQQCQIQYVFMSSSMTPFIKNLIQYS